MKSYFLGLLLCSSLSVAFSQADRLFIPSPLTDTIPPATHAALTSKLAYDKAHIQEPSKDIRNFIREQFDKRTSSVIRQYNDGRMMTESDLTGFLQKILNEVYAANPQLMPETRVYAYRSEAVNAMSFGEGTLSINLGLLSRLENESQVAFVLCHELAHHHLEHAELLIQELARLNFDPDLKKKVKDINKSNYAKFSRYEQLQKSLYGSITHHGREKEAEADSIGLVYFLKTSYNPWAAIRVMEILDSADISRPLTRVDLKRSFQFEGYPFKDSWLTAARGESWNRQLLDDSLRTHPQCSTRITALKRQLRSAPNIRGIAPESGSPEMQKIRERSFFEIAVSHYHFGEYGRGLYLYLQLADQYPQAAYVHAMIGNGLYQIYRKQKDHSLGAALPLPDNRFDENYDQFLQFMHALRLSELAALSYYYLDSKRSSGEDNEDFLYTSWLVSHTPASKRDPKDIRRIYQAKFPAGRYRALMN